MMLRLRCGVLRHRRDAHRVRAEMPAPSRIEKEATTMLLQSGASCHFCVPPRTCVRCAFGYGGLFVVPSVRETVPLLCAGKRENIKLV